MHTDLTQVLQEAARLAEATAEALSRGDTDAAVRLQQEAELAWLKARRLGQRQAKRPALSRVPSVRERAVAAVTELNLPSSPRLIAAYSQARTGEPFDVRAIASIRRDEYRSWTSGSRRDTYLVPSLEGPWLVAGRGRFALSHWSLSQRIIGPLSPRVDHLRVCLHLVAQIESLDKSNDACARLRALLAEYARSIPDALEDAWSSAGQELDTGRVRAATVAELDLIEADDENWRKREAERAGRSLSDEQQIWGGTSPRMVGGTI